ncbi:hypothetical protein SAMN02745246_02170 [Leeuwenhoekiella marinoflava DSM 3653]|uniref:Uncharacterized protein n=3 Tax=Leeuwenhoekiella marinoflava TaxID=988 RepID=A0A4Q0P6T6_9FLAO|nr:hypothetical protein DSL99_3959 [Leeuwenhoekiella marinoflava]SHF31570.1 hypothetical protein SAMN02745246_02170 [Leeuwenhoekiella marinoflava DSM 3653]
MLLAVFLTATFLFSSCENQNCDCEETETPVLSAPGNIIPVAAADTLYKNYGNSRVSLIELAENVTNEGDTIVEGDARYKKATRAVTMPYKAFKEYIAYIEQEAKAADVEIAEMRFYFGKYKNDFPQKNKKGRATLFLNPAAEFTLSDGTKDTVSYAIITGTNGKKRAMMVGHILNPKEGEVDMVGGETIESMSGDHTTLRPPPPLSDGDF